MNWVLNAAIYQLVWFVCVLGGNRYLLVSVLLLCLHFYLSRKRTSDLKIVVAVLVLGVVVDGVLRFVGFFSFVDDGFPIPLWLMMIWMALGTLPQHSLRWFQGRYLLATLFGAIGGPLAYGAGVRFGAAELGISVAGSLFLLAMLWAVVFPLIMYLAEKVGGASSA